MRKLRQSPVGKIVLALFALGILCYGLLFAVVQYGNRDCIVGEPAYMIVLGCKVMPSGEPSVLLQDRLDSALEYWTEHPQVTIVVSGGQGADEPTTEALAMSNYLQGQGVPGEQIIEEGASHNTYQNLTNSVALMAAAGYDGSEDVVIVSSGFHLTRGCMLWHRVNDGTGALSTLAAPTSHFTSGIYMTLREPLALVKSFLFDR